MMKKILMTINVILLSLTLPAITGFLLIFTLPTVTISSDNIAGIGTSYGSSKFTVWGDLKEIEQLKVVWDFNFSGPASVNRALDPVSYAIKATSEYGALEFEPIRSVVVSHGGEVAIWAKRNYQKYKDIVDHAARLSEAGVRFEVCSVAAQAQGFEVDDFHGFINVVPTGGLALIYWGNKDYAIIPAGSTTPAPIINPYNEHDVNKKR
jgi:intracellular sulfur oxidation DsrE/DsrF family protein